MKGFTTRAIHSRPMRTDPHGTLRLPVYDNVAFEFENSLSMQQAFEGRKLAHSYSRISNPTVADFEDRIRGLAGAYGVIAVSSGMAAISAVVLALSHAGSNIVTTRSLFGNTLSLFEDTLGPWGLEVRYVDMQCPEQLGSAIDSSTAAVFFEVITNPKMEVADTSRITQIAHEHDVPVILDGTVTTPYLFQSKQFGVDIEVISSTKYISGGATSVGGLVIDNGIFDWKKNSKLTKAARKYGPNALITNLRREVYRNLGSCMSPHNAFLQSLGLETLALRIDRSCTSALAIAKWLTARPEVTDVFYPGLESSGAHDTASRQFPRGFGGIVSFNLKGKEECFAFMDALKVVRRATNINDNKTLVLHPASTIFCDYSEEKRRQLGISDTMLRLSVGIEDLEDIFVDLELGLEAIHSQVQPSVVEARHDGAN